MSTAQIVVVHGATGLQGGSVTQVLSKAGYKVRAIVRDSAGAKARELAALPNVDLAVATLTKDSLIKAYTGADAVYACTPMGPNEKTEGTAMADAAKAAGIKTFIWSTLPSTASQTGGKIVVEHFDLKAEVSAHVKAIGLPAVHLYLGAFFDNFTNFGGLRKNDDGYVLTNMGVKNGVRVPQVAIKEDLGRAVDVMLKNQEAFIGKDVYLAPFAPTMEEQAKVVETLTGKKVTVVETTYPAEMAELGHMAEFFNTHGLYKSVQLPDPLLAKYGFEPSSWEDFVKANLAQIQA